ncbi:succinate-semialdehyde dehydrogenase [Phialemonium atrogriseum]|uniref:Succinate-semialdehyde dehydrogenase n=1 Tax=Phialemonium atrogriseum TaxID=1093897 RepID=A0AAJ0BVU4_9PEZI|nr:succinate-semialdehyde dehydrogenase [Phialemonium atrogriseum]KAK1763987.1 succinate-semialdehyde dehydrogenase [Phialemonium atrogriseum]
MANYHPRAVQHAISNPSLLHESAFIGGNWVSSSKTFPVYNPATKGVIANIADLGLDSFKQAIDHAQTAFEEFRSTTEHGRSRLLHRYAALIRANAKDLAVILTMENGKTLAEAEGEVEYGASFITWFAEEAVRNYGDIVPSQHPGTTNFIVRQPVGVCAIIAPWNFPIAMITRKLGPALAAGCTVVIKPPSETPLCTLALTELAQQAGFPPNVIQVVPTRDRTAVTELYTNPAIKKVSFTGSTGVGKMIAEKAAGTMKKVSMELGGNAPYIVFDDADLDKAVDGVLACKFRCSGQTCVCANRLFVQRGIHDAFVRALSERMGEFKVGSGLDPSVTHGPLINGASVAKVKSHIDDAVAKGAKLVCGGSIRDDLGGYFIEPALLTGVTPAMAVAREETFGPLAPVFTFDTIEECIKMANDTEFGLAGYFFSNNLKTIWHVAAQLEVGMVGVNTGKISAAEAPFGGIKESGLGREGSKYGLAEFQVMKNITLGDM